MAEIKIRLPDPIRLGEIVEVKTLALAPPLADGASEFDAEGLPIPHYVGLKVDYDGRPLLNTRFGPGVSRNVMFAFAFKADRAGPLELTWHLREGGTETRKLAIDPAR